MQEIREFSPGTALFRQGDDADVAYFILKGKVEISVEKNGAKSVIATVPANSIVGEMALLDKAPRMATVVATEPVQARAITAETLKKVVDAAPPLARHIVRSLVRTARLKVGMPASLDDDTPKGAEVRSHDARTKILDRRVYQKGATIFRAGDKAEGLYIVQQGEIEITRGPEGKRELLRTYTAGEVFGERGVFEKTERSADATAATQTTVEFVGLAQLSELIRDTPPILVGLIRIYMRGY